MKKIVLFLCFFLPEVFDKTALPKCNPLRQKNIRIAYSAAIFAIVIAMNANYFWMLGYWLVALASMPKEIVDSVGKAKHYSLLTLCVIGLLWLSCTPYAF